jgi:hypothetical protein
MQIPPNLFHDQIAQHLPRLHLDELSAIPLMKINQIPLKTNGQIIQNSFKSGSRYNKKNQ